MDVLAEARIGRLLRGPPATEIGSMDGDFQGGPTDCSHFL